MGELGVSIVSGIISDQFGWLFKRNPQEHDFGIDGQIEVVTEHGEVTGQMLACQIKCGNSYFKETNQWGYVYRGETKHFNYLANYPLPVIITICAPASREGYWVRFCVSEVEITEDGWKLTIPFDSKLSESKSELLALVPDLKDHLSVLREYWEENNLLRSLNLVIFMIDAEEVNNNDISRATDFCMRLRASREMALHCKGKIEIWFSGYDDDPRELFEIEEVKQFIKRLDKAFPELFFFVPYEPPAITLMLFVFCFAGVGWQGERPKPGNTETYMIERQSLLPFLRWHFDGLNQITDWLSLPTEVNAKISAGVGKLLGVHQT